MSLGLEAIWMAAIATNQEILVDNCTPCEHKLLTGGVFRLVGAKLHVLSGIETSRYLGLHQGPGQHFITYTKQLLVAGRKGHLGPCAANVPKLAWLPIRIALIVPVLSYGA